MMDRTCPVAVCLPVTLRSSRGASGWNRLGIRAAACLCFTLLPPGCGDARRNLDPMFLDHSEALALAEQARQSPLADERRDAIHRLARTDHVRNEEILRTLGLIAHGDASPIVRVAAISAIGSAQTAESCSLCAALLPADPEQTEQSLGEPVRIQLLDNLEHCAASGLLSADAADRAAAAGLRLLANDFARNARLAAARLLGHFPRRDVADALIIALEQRDFGVCHAAELSLQRLTGQRFDHDPDRWRAYFAQNPEPFARRDADTQERQTAAWNPLNWFSSRKP